MEDTIAAVATAYGEGGIGIVRISGENAEDIVKAIFRPFAAQNKKPIVNRRLEYGHIISPEDGAVIDEVLTVLMKAPGSYTREDVAEIQCHGSIVALGKIFALVLKQGARAAEPGEFTKRAFLNGRVSTFRRRKAVIDLIKAKTDKGFEVALDQMEGGLSTNIKEQRAGLMELLVQIAVNLDYPEEDIEELTYAKLKIGIEKIQAEIKALSDTAETGRMIRDGLRVTIAGRPNVGKSSLMNALLKESRGDRYRYTRNDQRYDRGGIKPPRHSCLSYGYRGDTPDGRPDRADRDRKKQRGVQPRGSDPVYDRRQSAAAGGRQRNCGAHRRTQNDHFDK